jgi:hypothetical protein
MVSTRSLLSFVEFPEIGWWLVLLQIIADETEEPRV